jgi:hypothetical protein
MEIGKVGMLMYRPGNTKPPCPSQAAKPQSMVIARGMTGCTPKGTARKEAEKKMVFSIGWKLVPEKAVVL